MHTTEKYFHTYAVSFLVMDARVCVLVSIYTRPGSADRPHSLQYEWVMSKPGISPTLLIALATFQLQIFDAQPVHAEETPVNAKDAGTQPKVALHSEFACLCCQHLQPLALAQLLV